MDIPPYAPGDVVRITEDIAEAIVLQEDHGGLDDEMAEVYIYIYIIEINEPRIVVKYLHQCDCCSIKDSRPVWKSSASQ